MLSNGSLLCTYDSANKLLSAGGHTYSYNAENVRIRNLCEDEDTTYTYNTNCKLSQLLVKVTGSVTTKYVYGKGLIGEESNGKFKTYHFDSRGSTIAITDENGNITDTFAYDTYGKQIARTGTSTIIFGYNGMYGVITDKNGLVYMRARYYSPEMRRFINADIVAGKITNATTLNRYAYANGNPISLVDPTGLSTEDTSVNKFFSGIKNIFSRIASGFNNLVEAIRTDIALTPSALEAAYMAQDIYYSTSEEYTDAAKEGFNGWTIVDVLADEKGFRIGVYQKTVNGKTGYVLVNKGSTTSNDWKNNFSQPVGKSEDVIKSIAIVQKFCEEHPDSKVTFVGHSKGGAEATANALATNRNAIVFNTATLNEKAYDLDQSKYRANMTVFTVEGEVLSVLFGPMSTPVDKQIIIGKDNIWKKFFKNATMIGQIHSAIELFSNHSIEKVIEVLQKEGYTECAKPRKESSGYP